MPPEVLNCELFQGMDASAIEGFMRHAQPVNFRAGECVMMTGQRCEAVYILHKGQVKVCLENRNGHSFTLNVLGPGATLGEVSLLDGGAHSATVFALRCLSTWRISVTDFRSELFANSCLALNLLRLMARRLRDSTGTVERLTTENLHQRIAHLLIAHARQQRTNGDLVVRLTQAELAQLAGATRSRVNRVLADYKHRECLTVDTRLGIVLHDINSLLECCGQ